MNDIGTYYIRPQDSEYSMEDWLDYIVEKCRSIRSTKLNRPVYREEFFEGSWDIYLTPRPKLKRSYNTNMEDLVAKMPQMEGHRRICIHASDVYIIQTDAQPSANVDEPFSKRYFIHLPSRVIASHGTQERYFILQVGRYSEIGSGQMFMRCDSYASAVAMNERLQNILLREHENLKRQGIPDSICKRKRDRRTNHARQRLNIQTEQNEHKNSVLQSQSSRASFKNKLSENSVEKNDIIGVAGLSSTGSMKKKSSIAGLLPSFRLKLGSTASTTRAGSIGNEGVSTSGNVLSARESQNYYVGEDYIPCNASSAFTRGLFDEASRKGSASFSGILANNPSVKQFTKSQANGNRDTELRKTSHEKDYTQMDLSSSWDLYPMPEVHSFVTNSPDKCSSPHSFDGARNPPRAYSVGAKSQPSTFTKKYVVGNVSASTKACGHSSNEEMLTDVRGRYGSTTSASEDAALTPPSSQRVTTSSMVARETPPTLHEETEDGSKKNSLTEATSGLSIESQPELSDVNISKQTTNTYTQSTNILDNVKSQTMPAFHKADELPNTLTPTTAGNKEDFSELRKRAYSLGSKSWKKPSFLKIASKRFCGRMNAPSTTSSACSSQTTTNCGEETLRFRANSGGSVTGTSVFSPTAVAIYQNGVPVIGRQNSARIAIGRADVDHMDHMELDFDQLYTDRGSCPSIESPLNRSRNSSLGVQLPNGMRAALDLALGSHCSFVTIRPSERYLESLYAEAQVKQQQQQRESLNRNMSENAAVTNADNVALLEKPIKPCNDEYVLMDVSAAGATISHSVPTKMGTSAQIDTILESTSASNSSTEENEDSKEVMGNELRTPTKFVVGGTDDDESNSGMKKLSPIVEHKAQDSSESSSKRSNSRTSYSKEIHRADYKKSNSKQFVSRNSSSRESSFKDSTSKETHKIGSSSSIKSLAKKVGKLYVSATTPESSRNNNDSPRSINNDYVEKIFSKTVSDDDYGMFAPMSARVSTISITTTTIPNNTSNTSLDARQSSKKNSPTDSEKSRSRT